MVLRALARPLMASAFLTRGVESWQHPGSRIPTAERVVEALPLPARGSGVAALVRDPEVLVRANGAVMAGAAALFALGTAPRLTSAALGVTMLPGAVFGHPFWRESDPAVRAIERQRFFTDLTLVGAAALAALQPTHHRP